MMGWLDGAVLVTAARLEQKLFSFLLEEYFVLNAVTGGSPKLTINMLRRCYLAFQDFHPFY